MINRYPILSFTRRSRLPRRTKDLLRRGIIHSLHRRSWRRVRLALARVSLLRNDSAKKARYSRNQAAIVGG